MTTAVQSPAAAPAPEEDVTTALYRAAIGPVSTSYYLPIFTRFEESGRAGISWNTAAGLTTFNWLVFRQLWAAALAYVGIVVAVLVLVFGIGRLVFQFSDMLMMALGLGFGLAAFVLPGLFGNVVLHSESRKRMAAAIAAHTDVKDALAQLNRQASTRRRAIAIAVANVAFWLLAVSAYQQLSSLSNVAVMPQGALESGHVAVGRAVDGSVSPATSQPIMPAMAVSAAAPVAAVSAPASAPASAAAAAPASAPASAASAPATVASAPTPAASAAPAASAPVAAASVASAPVAAPQPVASQPTKPHTPAASAPPATSAKGDKAQPKKAAASAAKPAPKAAPKPAAKATPAATSTEHPYFINVGLFAVPENAARAHEKLRNAQLPSVTKELKSAKGPLTRVRVGPFASQQEAQAAALKIKALQLDAIIVQP